MDNWSKYRRLDNSMSVWEFYDYFVQQQGGISLQYATSLSESAVARFRCLQIMLLIVLVSDESDNNNK